MADVSVINFGDGGGNRNIKDKNAARSSAIAPIEDGSTSSAAYSVGDYICRNGQLYKVTTDIAIGDIIGNNIQLTKVVDEMGGSGDNVLSKIRYQITATNWSNSVDANGYYTYTLTLNPTLSTTYSPNIWIAGATDNTLATDTEKAQYDLLNEQCNLTSESTLVLYAKTKPTSDFYIWVESKASGSGGGSGSGEIYSTEEVEIGIWCGAKLYRKGFDVGSLTGGQTLEYSTGLSNITVRDYWAMITRTSDGNVWKAPYVWSTSGQNIGMGVDAINNVTRILLRAGADYSGITGFAFLEYTKNS